MINNVKVKTNQRVPNKNADLLKKMKKISLIGAEVRIIKANLS